MNAADQRRLTPLLVVCVGVLAAILLMLWSGVGRGVHWLAPRPLAEATSAHHVASLPTPLPLQGFAVVWQKPLFSPDRKPVANVADGGTSLGDLTLTGIILTPSLHMALLRNKNGDRQVRLREGEAMPDGSVTLVEVRPRSALFDASGGRTELKLPAGAVFDDAKGAIPPDAPGNADQKATSEALISIGAHGAGRQAGRPGDAGASSGSPPTSDSSSAAAIQRLRAINARRRAERAAAAH